MQFVLIAQDYADALPRRMEARQRHLDMHADMVRTGNMLYGAALLNEQGNMAGSMIVCEFPDRAALDAYLTVEPYILARVWEKVDIRLCRVAPSHAK